MSREVMEYDVVIVGAGPAGLSAAIRLKQLAPDASVCVVEKGSEVGAHILSGAVIDPIALTELLPEWQTMGAPVKTAVSEDQFLILTRTGKITLPNWLLPPLMHNHGNYIVSLGNLCRWLGEQAEGLGVEIYPGFAAAEVLYDDAGRVVGIATGDMGISRTGEQLASYTPGVELRAKYTLFAEGVRGSLSKALEARFGLREGVQHQTYGIGLKELWRVDPARHRPGLVMHSQGWPLDSKTGGGSFLYHLEDGLVSVGFVVHLNYQNPHLSPFEEFQRFKTHPAIRPTFEGGERISYGARAINEGGLQSVPGLIFPGGALIGCAAGFVNLPRIKGSHNAMKTGMLAAEAAAAALAEGRAWDRLEAYPAAYRSSWVYEDLRRVRNVKPGLKLGLWLGTAFGGFTMWAETLGLKLPFTLGHGTPDHACLKPAAEMPRIEYPKPDGVVSFDRLSSVFLSGTNHEEDQPVHLRLTDATVPVAHNLPLYDEPAQRYCPAGVYEIVRPEGGEPRFQINAQNCVHCKTCDIKDPTQNITWVVPQGGGGPTYPNM
ncbi:MAG: electron transfer flavoprotein-ubiquinone oxidoreductase [Alphaproteobacteria bacterium]|nr:electron transfer flavoprotein-ubiquinone oxidoreductase [Alphaproteobacteria bacterium]